MRSNLLEQSAILSVVVLLAINPAMPALASGTTVQQFVSPTMRGFVFASSGCCPDVSTNLYGNVATGTYGTMELLQQSGTITIGTTSYSLQFIPTDKLYIQSFSDGCSSGTTYNQGGEIKLTGSDGTIIKGSGKYSWGSFPDCSGGTYTFTNFSGEIEDSMGQSTNFYTGADSLPAIQ